MNFPRSQVKWFGALMLLLVGCLHFQSESNAPSSTSIVDKTKKKAVVQGQENAEQKASKSAAEISWKSEREEAQVLIENLLKEISKPGLSESNIYLVLDRKEAKLKKDERLFSAYQSLVIDRMISAEYPYQNPKEAYLFPLVSYVDPKAGQEVLRTVLESYQSIDQSRAELYVKMMGDWAVDEWAVQSLLDLNEAGAHAIGSVLEILKSRNAKGFQVSIGLIQKKVKDMESQESALKSQYVTLLKHYSQTIN